MNMDAYERLMRYADGEVSATERVEIEAWLARDEAARRTLAQLRAERGAIRASFQGGGADPAARRRLDDAMEAAFAARRRRRWVMQGALPVAAAVALAVVASAVTLTVAERRFDTTVATLAMAYEQDRALDRAALEEALETRVSGETLAWSNPQTRVEGSVTPTRTFRGAGGLWCREYRREVHGMAFDDVRLGIACRAETTGADAQQEATHWRVAVERPSEV